MVFGYFIQRTIKKLLIFQKILKNDIALVSKNDWNDDDDECNSEATWVFLLIKFLKFFDTTHNLQNPKKLYLICVASFYM